MPNLYIRHQRQSLQVMTPLETSFHSRIRPKKKMSKLTLNERQRLQYKQDGGLSGPSFAPSSQTITDPLFGSLDALESISSKPTNTSGNKYGNNTSNKGGNLWDFDLLDQPNNYVSPKVSLEIIYA